MTEKSDQQPSKRGGPGRPFQKGVSGNPGGRPPGAHAFAELCRAKTPQALDALEKALKEPRERVAAAQVLLAYAHGKPIQRNEHTGADGGPIQTQQVEDPRAPIDELIAGALAKAQEQKETRH